MHILSTVATLAALAGTISAASSIPTQFILQAKALAGSKDKGEYGNQYVYASFGFGGNSLFPVLAQKQVYYSNFWGLTNVDKTDNGSFYSLTAYEGYGSTALVTMEVITGNDFGAWNPVLLQASTKSSIPKSTQQGFYLEETAGQYYLSWTSDPAKPKKDTFGGWMSK
jgi:hypothetical protein